MIKDKDEHYLLDTNIISELFRYCADFNVLNKIIEHSSDMAMTAFTLDELLYGTNLLPDGRKKKALLDFIQNDVRENFSVVLFDEKAAEIHAEIQATLEKKGKPAPYDDSLIAATAIANDMILVTRNTDHFAAIATSFPLKLENWFTPES